MSAVRLTALLLLSSCSLIAKGKSATGVQTPTDTSSASSASSSASSASSSAGEAGTTASSSSKDNYDEDTDHAMKQIDSFEKELTANHVAQYALEAGGFRIMFVLEHKWADSKQRPAVVARLDALDAKAIKTLGGRVATTLGDGHRVLKLDPDAVEADLEAIEACNAAAHTTTTGEGAATAQLAKAIAAYEKSMARAVKMDPNALRYLGAAKGGDKIDVPTKLMACEASLGGVATQFGDEYAPETAGATETEKGCGEIDFLADGVSLGGRQWAAYERTAGGASYAEKMPCNKMPKRNTYPSALAGAVKEFAENSEIKLSKLVVQVDGAPYTEVSDEDLHTYRYQKLKAYSHDFAFAKNPCGAAKMFCEAGGSQAMAHFNRLEFELDRAAAHAGQDQELCKSHLKAAREQAKWFEDFYKQGVQTKSWISGATYKTKKGATLSEKQLIEGFASQGQTADDHLTDHFCSSKK